jgi:hypothetical protein
VLFVRAELLNSINNRRQQGLWRQFAMPAQCFDEALLRRPGARRVTGKAPLVTVAGS